VPIMEAVKGPADGHAREVRDEGVFVFQVVEGGGEGGADAVVEPFDVDGGKALLREGARERGREGRMGSKLEDELACVS